MFIFKAIVFITAIATCFGDLFYHIPSAPPSPTLICPPFEKQYVKFYLYTRTQESKIEWISGNPIPINESTYDKEKDTKIIVHGWLQRGEIFSAPLVNAYLKMMDVNVIVADYSHYSTCEWFHVINSVIPHIGQSIADVIRELWDLGQSARSFHIIGHSLGSHVAAHVGKKLPVLIGRITGLDPAGGTFQLASDSKRLCPNDARFVDVIYTNAGGFGIRHECGHANFYVNGGLAQYMCNPLDALCHHQISVIYFTESILHPDRFCALKCDHYMKYKLKGCLKNEIQHMGEYVHNNASGTYYIDTDSREPFGILC